MDILKTILCMLKQSSKAKKVLLFILISINIANIVHPGNNLEAIKLLKTIPLIEYILKQPFLNIYIATTVVFYSFFLIFHMLEIKNLKLKIKDYKKSCKTDSNDLKNKTKWNNINAATSNYYKNIIDLFSLIFFLQIIVSLQAPILLFARLFYFSAIMIIVSFVQLSRQIK